MRYLLIVLFSLLSAIPALAENQATKIPVVVSGTVPDESTHAKLLARVREIYGADNVVDQVVIGKVTMPPNWVEHLNKLLDQDLHQISHGQLKVEGNLVSIRGEVANEAQRQQIASDMATHLNPSYTIHNGLHVTAQDQGLIDKAIANRNIEFDSGSANLKEEAHVILDAVADAMNKLKDKHVDITGYTDNQGLRESNINLSKARADAVKDYLVNRHVDPDHINTYGMGPDRPIASNSTAEGRARNRRIEFRVVQ